MWMYKFLFIVFPFAIVASLGVVLIGVQGLWECLSCSDLMHRYPTFCCSVIGSTLLLSFIFSLSLMVLSIIFEIFVFLYIAFYFERTYMSRFPKSNVSDLQTWQQILSFIYQNKSYDISDIADDFDQLQLKEKTTNSRQTPYICSAKQDRIIRICCINYGYLSGMSYINTQHTASDIKLLHFLRQQQTSFCNIDEYDEILKHSSQTSWPFTDQDNSKGTIPWWKKFWAVYTTLWVEVNAAIDNRNDAAEKRQGQWRNDEARLAFDRITGKVTRWLVFAVTFIFGPLYII